MMTCVRRKQESAKKIRYMIYVLKKKALAMHPYHFPTLEPSFSELCQHTQIGKKRGARDSTA